MKEITKYIIAPFIVLSILGLLYSCSSIKQGTFKKPSKRVVKKNQALDKKNGFTKTVASAERTISPYSSLQDDYNQFDSTKVHTSEVPTNGFSKIAALRNYSGEIPIITSSLKEFTRQSNFKVLKQQFYTSDTNSIFLISTQFSFVDEQSNLVQITQWEAYNKSDDTIWTTHENYCPSLCILQCRYDTKTPDSARL